jgi:hypothetical protein
LGKNKLKNALSRTNSFSKLLTVESSLELGLFFLLFVSFLVLALFFTLFALLLLFVVYILV